MKQLLAAMLTALFVSPAFADGPSQREQIIEDAVILGVSQNDLNPKLVDLIVGACGQVIIITFESEKFNKENAKQIEDTVVDRILQVCGGE